MPPAAGPGRRSGIEIIPIEQRVELSVWEPIEKKYRKFGVHDGRRFCLDDNLFGDGGRDLADGFEHSIPSVSTFSGCKGDGGVNKPQILILKLIIHLIKL